MSSYLLNRLLQFIAVLLGITIFTFCLIRLIPGDPCEMTHGLFVPREVIEHCRTEYGLDKPILQQFYTYLSGFFSSRAMTGQSIVYQRPAISVFMERLPTTLLLAGYGCILSVLIGLFIGLSTAMNPGSFFDRSMNGATAATLALPPFMIALLLIIVFSLKLHLFPTSGYGRSFWDHLQHLFLPALTLALSNGAMLARVLRRSLLNVIDAPYILTAHAKGVPQRRVLLHHVFRNSLISPVTLLGLQIAWLCSGAVVVETVFALPGLGSLIVQSVLDRDYPVIQITTAGFAVMVGSTSLLTDLIYPWLDPRVRHD